ncbi:antitoxin [cyanobacterium TDX16]|nr:antitoxin [cyanobacterium TDX16]
MNWEDRIVIDPEVLVGKPVFKGSRLAVEFIVSLMAQGWSHAEILKNYPGLTQDDLLACLSYAEARLKCERIYPLSA